MEPATGQRLADMLRAEIAGDAPPRLPFVVDAARYRDTSWCERERAVFAAHPRIAAASSEIAAGACLPCDLPGLSLLLVRDRDGTLRGFHNACRHRGTRLVDAPCAAKAFVCPYHGWTYDLAGELIHIPHDTAFVGVDRLRRGLRELAIVERDGLVWVAGSVAASGAGSNAAVTASHSASALTSTSAFDAPIAAELAAELAADLAALELDRHIVWRRARAVRRCNWKLVIEAFLDGYHLRVLHRDSIYRFFIDAASVAEPAGPHIRAMTARRALAEAPSGAIAASEIRELGTPSFLIFPGTVIIEHPDFVSIMVVSPLTADTCAWEHAMLVPRDRAADDAHWQRSWSLIEETVFEREDLWVCEQIQRSVATGAADELVFGGLEYAVRYFHDALDVALGAVPP